MANRDTIIKNCKKYLGTPYVWGGESMSEGGFDCSGYAYNVLRDSGYKVSRTTANGYRSLGTKIAIGKQSEGDLLFYGTNNNAYHIAFYAGNNMMYESTGNAKNTKSNPGKGVVLSQLKTKDLMEVRRIVDDITSTTPTKTKIQYTKYSKEEFIEKVSSCVNTIRKEFGIEVASPIIAQACLESAYGTTNKATHNNYFGLKYRENRCPSACGTFVDGSTEQLKDGTIIPITDQWFEFETLEKGIRGYFEYTNIDRYKALKGEKDPRKYLEKLKAAGYATALNYVDAVYNVITKWDLTRYDSNEVKTSPTTPFVPYTSVNSTSDEIASGKEIHLKNTKCYSTELVTTHYGIKNGTFYLWDNVVINGRIRITNAKSRVGVKGQVTCWVKIEDIGLINSTNNKTTTYITIKAGTKFSLKNTPVYNSETGITIGNRTGVWYTWEDEKVGQKRIRMTNILARVGVKGQVSFFVDVDNLK